MRIFGSVLLLLAGSLASRGVNPGDEVVVIYNSRVPQSKALAEYYASKRQVPTNQIFGFGISTNEEISRAEFRDNLQKPLARMLGDHKLWHIVTRNIPATNNQPARVESRPTESKIRYAVLCYGVPLKIASDPSIKEEATEKMRPEMRRNEAAVDSELALLPLLEDKLPISGPLRNPVYTATNLAVLNPTNGILLVGRLDGPTPEIAHDLVDKALQAEADGLWGRAYFDLRNTSEPGYKMGDDWIRNAAEICHRLGFETTVDQNPDIFPAGFPMSQIAVYVGWYAEDASGPFAQPSVEFMPGAFAYHLHSYSAETLRSTTKRWTGPLLAKGATASMGCVYEPYLAGTPDMGIFIARFLFNGFSLGEAAYACQPVLSWQTTVVGDPLYRPFGGDPDQLQDALQQRHSKMLEWSYLRVVDLNLATGKPVAQCVDLLEQMEMRKHSAVLSEKLGDLYSAQGKPSSALFEYEQALSLEPSPMQRVRLLLTLGEKLAALGREAEAYDAYARLLRECADYPDKASVYKKLVPLAQKLNKPQEMEKWQAALDKSLTGSKPENSGLH